MRNTNRISSIDDSLRFIAWFLGIMVIVVVCMVLQAMQSILMPFCIAIFLVYMMEPVQRVLNRFGVPTIVRTLVILALSALVLFLVGILIYSSANSLTQNLPQYEKRVYTLVEGLVTGLKIPSETVDSFTRNFKWTDHLQPGAIARYLGQGFGTFVDFISKTFMVLLYMVYLLLQRELFPRIVEHAFPDGRGTRIMSVLRRINHQIVSYLDIKTAISATTGVLAAVILSAFGVDFAIFWGILTFLLNFIPAIGSIIATIPPIAVAFLQFDSMLIPISVSVCLISLQLTIGNVIEPKVMGNRLGINPLVVILALIFWGWLWGPVGMILSVPIVSAIQIVCSHFGPLRPIGALLADKPIFFTDQQASNQKIHQPNEEENS